MAGKRMRRGLLVLLLLAAGSCGLPDRDNPRDPAHRPVPLLLVTDVSKPDGSCPCTLAAGNLTCDASLEGSTVAAASRGRCLALDARESTDPDEALAELDHRFFVLASGGEIELTSPADGVLATNGLFLLGASLRSMLPTETEITFLARTEDPQGNYASDGTVLTLFNSRPELQAPSTRTFPFGGFPWLLDEPAGAPDFDVDFRADGLVTDPDSSDIEHLVYCWTIGPDPEACHRDPAHPDFSRTLPSDQLQVVPAYLRVSDWAGPEAEATAHPETFSNTVRTRVVIGTSPLWIADDDGTFGMERIDPLHESLSFTGGNAIQSPDPMWAAPFGDDLLYVTSQPSSMIVYLTDPAPPVAPSIDLPSGALILDLVSDAANDRFWVAYESSSPPDEPLCSAPPAGEHLTLRGFDGSLTERVCVHLPFNGEKPRPLQLSIDSSGTVWAIERFGSSLLRIAPAPGSIPEVILAADPNAPILLDVMVRPGSDEVWVIERTEPFASPFPTDMFAVVFDAATGSALASYDLQTSSTVFGPWWVDNDRFWTYTEGEGLRLVDARALEEGFGIEVATAERVVSTLLDLNSTESELPDATSGGLWARVPGNPQTQAIFASPMGEAFYYDVSIFRPQFVDSEGALWQSNRREELVIPAFVLERGFVPGIRGVVTTIPALVLGAQPDLSGGGVWSAGVLSPGLSRFAENGDLIDRMDTYLNLSTGLEQAVPPIIRLQISADGSDAWALGFSLDTLTPTDIFWFDLVARSGRVVAPDAPSLGLEFFAAAVPESGDAPFAWTVRNTGSELQLQKLTDTGFDAPLFVFPPTEFSSIGTVSQRSSALCVATLDATETVMRRILPDGTVHELGRVAVLGAAEAVSASHDPEDLCWVRTIAPGGGENITGWKDDGDPLNAPDRSFGVDLPMYDGDVRSFVAVSIDEVWVVLEPPEGGSRITRFEFLTSNTVRTVVDFRSPRVMSLLRRAEEHD